MAPSNRATPREFYRRFAQYYDAICGDTVARARRYLDQGLLGMSAAGRTALDLGCGTGHTAAILSEAGWQVIGYDASDEMLSQAQRRCPHARFKCVDFRKLPTDASAALAVCFGDTLNHLTDKHEWALVFRQLAQNLTPGGVFLFDVLTPYDHQEVWPQSLEVVEPGEEYLLIVRTGYDCVDRRAWLHHTWFLRAGPISNQWRRFDNELPQASFPEKDIRQWLREALFCDIVFRDGDTCGPQLPTSTRWFVRCRRD